MRPLRVGVLVVVVLAMSGVALSLLAGVPRPDGWRAIGARLLGSPAPAPASATGSLHAAAAGGVGGVPEPGQRSQRGFDPRQLLDRGRGTLQSPAGPHEFYFTRAIYRSGGWRGQPWATDFPKSDRQFMTIVNRLIEIDASERENAIRLDDPNIRKYPFLYALEVGDIALSPPEVEGLRNYLLAGGFLVIDDFWGSWQWSTFERQIRRVLPEHPIIDIPLDHPIFNTVYKIEEIIQVPAINNHYRGRTWEYDGYTPHTRGIFDEQGRLMVMINWNTDLGDAWEWAERPEYPLKYSTFAVEMGVNFIVYAMSH